MLAAKPRMGSLKINEKTAANADNPVIIYIGRRPNSKDKTKSAVIKNRIILSARTSPLIGTLGLSPYKRPAVFRMELINHEKLSTTNSPVSLPISVVSTATLLEINTGYRLMAKRAATTTPIAVMNPEREAFDNMITFNLEPEIFYLSAGKSRIIAAPAGYASCMRADLPDSILMVLSDKTIAESAQDSWKFDKNLWINWEKLERKND